MSLSNQSQEEAGSDSDQQISGSDLGSSTTSLEKDGDDGGLKEWGREESTELQWCYPSLLNTSLQEDIGDGEREEAECGQNEVDEERGNDEKCQRIIKVPLDHTDIEDSIALKDTKSEGKPPRKKVTLMGSESPLPLSPSKQPTKHHLEPHLKPTRSSGLDCGDLDPFVQSDSFVYLAVSARPGSQVEATTETEIPNYDTKQQSVQQYPESQKTYLTQSRPEGDNKPIHLGPQKPEEADFLCTDSFVYLAAPACLLLDPTGTTTYSGRYVYFCVFRVVHFIAYIN